MLNTKEMIQRGGVTFGKRTNGPAPRPMSQRTATFVANSQTYADAARRAGDEDLAQSFEAQGRRMLEIERRFA